MVLNQAPSLEKGFVLKSGLKCHLMCGKGLEVPLGS